MSIFRPGLTRLASCPHGSISASELKGLGLVPGEVIDFSVNTNPFGPSPLVASALSQVDIARYPDSEAIELRVALSQKLGVEPQNIIVSNGSTELIWLLASACLRQRDVVLIIGPTFGEYQRASRIASARVIFHLGKAEDGFRLDTEETIRLIRKHLPRLVFLCNPNNPTGLYVEREAVEGIAYACEEGLLVVDEAYLGFVERPWSSVSLLGNNNLFLMRSMTKDHALAGLRLGYGIGTPQVVSSLSRVRPPWGVNAAAQAAGLASLQDAGHLIRSKEQVSRAKRYVTEEIAALGFRVIPSATNFFLVEVGNASAFRQALLSKGCCVRDCTSFGLPSFIRIGVRTLPECQRLVGAIKEVSTRKKPHKEGRFELLC